MARLARVLTAGMVAALAGAVVWNTHSQLREGARRSTQLELALAEAERRLEAIEAAQALQTRLLASGIQSAADTRGPCADGSAAAHGLAEREQLNTVHPEADTPETDTAPAPTFSETAERSLAGQSLNPGWSREMRGELLALIGGSGMSAELGEVDCRTRLCRIDIGVPSADRDRLTFNLSGAKIFENGVVFEHSQDGEMARMTLYVAREREALAAISELQNQ